MPRTDAGPNGPRHSLTLDAAERAHPEWRPWLRLLRLALAESRDPEWAVDVGVSGARGGRAPMLHDAIIAVPGRRAAAWIAALLEAASDDANEEARLPASAATHIDAAALMESAIAMDHDRLAVLAHGAGADPGALEAIGGLAALPALRAVRRLVAPQLPATWAAGWCPVCGAWPSMVEMRGLERERRLRCGRCAADWRTSVLRCPFCDEQDHANLRALVPEGEEERRRIETCSSCHGYVKAMTTLMQMPDEALAAADVLTLPLDLVALERGFSRPSHAGHAVRVRVQARENDPVGGGTHTWLMS